MDEGKYHAREMLDIQDKKQNMNYNVKITFSYDLILFAIYNNPVYGESFQ